MDKTEKRTAESIVSKNNPNEGWPRWVTKKSAIESCEEYAAQELDAYKARLKKRIRDWNSTSIEEVPPSYSWKDIFELIDTI